MDSIKIDQLSNYIQGNPEFAGSKRNTITKNDLVGIAETAKGSGQFSDMLQQSLAKVNQDQVEADSAIKELIAGRTKNIHETLLTVERADASLKLMMQVRNKILDAYKEIMRMQV